jgi:hypothetical protein
VGGQAGRKEGRLLEDGGEETPSSLSAWGEAQGNWLGEERSAAGPEMFRPISNLNRQRAAPHGVFTAAGSLSANPTRRLATLPENLESLSLPGPSCTAGWLQALSPTNRVNRGHSSSP